MNYKFLSRVALISLISIAIAVPVRADSLQTEATEAVIAIVAVTATVAVLATVLILRHKAKKSAITGCVKSDANGLNLTDEGNKRTYSLSGDTVGIKPGDRMTLEGKRKNDKLVFQARKVTRDLGACQP